MADLGNRDLNTLSCVRFVRAERQYNINERLNEFEALFARYRRVCSLRRVPSDRYILLQPTHLFSLESLLAIQAIQAKMGDG